MRARDLAAHDRDRRIAQRQRRVVAGALHWAVRDGWLGAEEARAALEERAAVAAQELELGAPGVRPPRNQQADPRSSRSQAVVPWAGAGTWRIAEDMALDRPQEGSRRPCDRYPLHVVVHIPPPRLHRLRRVVPIGQAQEYHGVAVLALALEVYEAGFVATCQIQSLGAWPDQGDADAAERNPWA